jgi:hypothetical protein
MKSNKYPDPLAYFTFDDSLRQRGHKDNVLPNEECRTGKVKKVSKSKYRRQFSLSIPSRQTLSKSILTENNANICLITHS